MQIVVDCERMKYPNTGLYHFCLQLAQALQRNHDDVNEKLKFYVREQTMSDFGEGFSFIRQHSLHKFMMPLKKEYDIWHSTYQATNYFPSGGRIKKVLTIHDLNILYEDKPEHKREKYLKKLAQKIRHSDHITVISNYVKTDIEKYFDLSSKPVTVIYNGCNISANIISSLDTSKQPGSPFLFTIGTIVDKKNFHVLPSLLVGNNLLLVISGIVQSADYKARIISHAATMGVLDRIIFTDSISEEEKYWYLENCEAFLFPSLAEGFGLPVIEAMHFGKPVFLSSCTSLPEIGADAAYYFKNFDPEHMRDVFNKGMQQYNNTQPMAHIKKRASLFNWDTAAKAYLELYRSL